MAVFLDNDVAKQAVFTVSVSSLDNSLGPPPAEADGGCCPILLRFSKTCTAAWKPSSWPFALSKLVGRADLPPETTAYVYLFRFPFDQKTGLSSFCRELRQYSNQ